MKRMVNVPQIFMVMTIPCSEFHHLNSEILDLEYLTLKIPESSIFIRFLNSRFGKTLPILKIYVKMDGMVNVLQIFMVKKIRC